MRHKALSQSWYSIVLVSIMWCSCSGVPKDQFSNQSSGNERQTVITEDSIKSEIVVTDEKLLLVIEEDNTFRLLAGATESSFESLPDLALAIEKRTLGDTVVVLDIRTKDNAFTRKVLSQLESSGIREYKLCNGGAN